MTSCSPTPTYPQPTHLLPNPLNPSTSLPHQPTHTLPTHSTPPTHPSTHNLHKLYLILGSWYCWRMQHQSMKKALHFCYLLSSVQDLKRSDLDQPPVHGGQHKMTNSYLVYALCCQSCQNCTSIPLDLGWLEWILVGWQHADGLSQMSDESLHPLQYNK